MDMLAVFTPVLVRMVNQPDREYSSHVESIDSSVVVIAAPTGAAAALLASGSRQVELSWLSPRGRYEQRCELVEAGGSKQWRLRPARRPVLIQRRRYIRVRAALSIRLLIEGDELQATTVDVSEGGFRVRLPRRRIDELARTTVHATVGGTPIAVPGYVLRSTDAASDQTEAVIAFEAGGAEADAIRRFVLNTQLRARAARGPGAQ
jgi:c-di-GMP-binding flagellar brake protein YcgR